MFRAGHVMCTELLTLGVWSGGAGRSVNGRQSFDGSSSGKGD